MSIIYLLSFSSMYCSRFPHPLGLGHKPNQVMNRVGKRSSTQPAMNCRVHAPYRPSFYLLILGEWQNLGVFGLFLFPIVFPSSSHKFSMGSQICSSTSRCVAKHVPNSTSLCPICFAQQFPIGTDIRKGWFYYLPTNNLLVGC